MPSYGLNPNGLLDSSAELQGVTTSIQNAIDELNTVVQTYVNANSGDTREAFTAAQTKWNTGINEMRQALADASSRLDQIHDNYRLGDARGAALFQGNV
ncbi:WXG100 family type VII secretion target [Micromonospora wenchangensis]|uniref:WXG100 family type VII secretion target n=1 Tax=Micromonospora wenchangensis TaxID=1185415 RepID=UPI003809FEED